MKAFAECAVVVGDRTNESQSGSHTYSYPENNE
jgi:hypothetical protein